MTWYLMMVVMIIQSVQGFWQRTGLTVDSLSTVGMATSVFVSADTLVRSSDFVFKMK